MEGSLPRELRAVHRGPVIGPGDPPFDTARRTFNALVDTRPLVITRPVDEADVAAAISVAARREVPVSVRGGGHSVAGHCVGEGGVMIDLRLMREVHVETDARRQAAPDLDTDRRVSHPRSFAACDARSRTGCGNTPSTIVTSVPSVSAMAVAGDGMATVGAFSGGSAKYINTTMRR